MTEQGGEGKLEPKSHDLSMKINNNIKVKQE